MRNHESVVIDSPGVVAVLMHEPLLHRQVFLQPLPTMPFADDGIDVSGLAKRLGYRPFVGIERVNPPRFLAGQLIHVRRQLRVSAMETRLSVSHVIGQDQHNVGATARNLRRCKSAHGNSS